MKKSVFVIIGLFLLGLAVRVSNFNFVFTDLFGHLNFIDPDSFYQLRRLFYYFSTGQFLQFDPAADWPEGSAVDWPEGFALIFGAFLWPFSSLLDSFRQFEAAAAFLNVIFGLVSIFFVYLLGKELGLSRAFVFLLLAFAALNPNLITFSNLAVIDHHGLEILFSLGSILFLVFSFRQKEKLNASLSGLFLFLGVLTSSSAIFVLGALWIGLLSFGMKRYEWKRAGFFSGGFLIPLLFYLVINQSFDFSYLRPSLFHLFIFLFFLIIFVSRSYFRPKVFLAFMLGFLLAFGFLWLIDWPAAFFDRLYWAFQYVVGRGGVLQNVFEAQPLFYTFEGFDLAYAFTQLGYLFFVILFFPLLLLSRKEQAFRFFIMVGMALLIPAFFQKRFLHLGMGLYLVSFLFCTQWLYFWAKQKYPKWKALVPVAIAVFTLAPWLESGLVPAVGVQQRIDFSLISAFHQEISFPEKEVKSRLLGKENPEYGIWANPNLGHMLQYSTGQGVVLNSFYKYPSLLRDFELRSIQSMEEFHAQLKKWNIRYIFVQNDFRYFELLHRLLNKDASYFYKEDPVSNAITIDLNALEEFAWVRLVIEDQVPNGFRRILSNRFEQSAFYDFVRLYEVADSGTSTE